MSTRPFIAARIEEVLDRWVERVMRSFGWREQVICYTGYGTAASLRLLGRVVLVPGRAHTGIGRATEEFVRRRGFRNFFTAAVVRAAITIEVGGQVISTTTDRGGYFDERVRNHGLEPGWRQVPVRSAESAQALADVHIVADDQRFGIISDIDDTIITTLLPRPMIAAWNTFIRDESARQAVPGMARLYTELLRQHPGAPVVYISTGAWNTHDFLSRFLTRHAYPHGPRLMTDWGPTNTGWFRSGPAHKRETMLQLTRDFPEIRWLLVGDDGQHDLALYSEFAQLAPDRVRAIAIRQLSPAEQLLAHGSATALEEEGRGLPCGIGVYTAPDGRGLLAQLRDLPELT
ncbi:MAG: phosphatase domain-containing protein [Propionicimonas sp.]|uniref:App1 family protein n=1 Tax=Propionicimonas sp. TaxID=1955623 RepID=UPI002B214DA7|nr:phosphatase domain-containing protein [Propionicimonas sp.]MEA4943664.1 phosphatase domain-containing protein [Propionicimonas sp.]MEA5055451.1 phosphatase domain-containing protein [Propionicimonas sp.]